MQEPRSAASASFPYTMPTVCHIEVASDGTVTFGRDAGTYERARSAESRLYAVWPGQYRSDLFAIDDLDEYAGAFGIIHDERRTGLADHEHQIRWSISSHETDPGGTYVSVDVRFDCGCRIKDLDAFAKQMREQKGWAVATSTGFSASWSADNDSRFTVRVRRTSLGR